MEPVDTRVTALTAVDQMKADIKDTDAQIRTTQASLHGLADQQYGDLRPAYNTFQQNVSKTDAMHNQLNQDATGVSTKSYQYVNNWSYSAREIRDPAMRDASISRQEQARKDQEQMVAKMNNLQGSYVQYIQSLRDAQMFAANDLTPEGMKQLREHAARVDQNARNLRQTMAGIDSDLTSLADAWRTDVNEPSEWGGPAQAQPAGGMMPGESPTTAPSR
jgi:hypothetical protein